MIHVNLKAFKKLRKYIAEKVENRQIDMSVMYLNWPGKYSAKKANPTISEIRHMPRCKMCLGGAMELALSPARVRRDEGRTARPEALFPPTGDVRGLFSTHLDGWPSDLRILYNSNKRNRKRAMLKLCDRIIAAGGIDWQ